MPEKSMNVLSLFSGIQVGGMELGLERAGMSVVGQVELDPFCRRVLAKHWPEVPRHDDVRTCVDWWWSEPRPPVHVVAGGFPCQPFSTAGRREGIADERWGWPWLYNVVRVLRPWYVVVENVAALLADQDAFGQVLGDLAESGYDAEWDCIPAASVGAPHRRDRLFLVAYANSEPRGPLGDALARDGGTPVPGGPPEPGRRCSAVADADGERLEGGGVPEAGRGRPGADARRSSPQVFGRGLRPGGEWAAEPAVCRVAHGLPGRLLRPQLHALGNAVVPQVAEHIGRLIVAADGLVPA